MKRCENGLTNAQGGRQADTVGKNEAVISRSCGFSSYTLFFWRKKGKIVIKNGYVPFVSF